jgi:uncharacterized protein (DUF1800 family)
MSLMRRTAIFRGFAVLALFVAVGGAVAAQKAAAWTAEEAEHLLNRAAFGGTPEEIAELVALGREAAVDRLLAVAESDARAVAARPTPAVDVRAEARRRVREEGRTLSPESRRALLNEARQADGRQLLRYRDEWVGRMITAEYPVAEKVALFWAGHFTSSQRDVKNSALMIRQAETLRRGALGSFRTLLYDVARDPAMLAYLDNDDNRKRAPNENFAREVMELFTLGEGRYTEVDVKEAARAFTGWRSEGGAFVLDPRQHDFGEKTVLGRTGRFGGDDVLEILLASEDAPRFVASRLLAFFVTPDPRPDLVLRYADALRKHDWRLRPVLRELFLDPAFYAEDVKFGRILGPVEFGVAVARKFPGVKPPARLVATAADALGQSLFAPPNVKGWEGGEAWINTASALQRGNLALAMIEGLDAVPGDVFRRPSADLLGAYDRAPFTWKPTFEIGAWLESLGVTTPEGAVDALCERFLSGPVSAESRATLIAYVRNATVDGRFVVRGPVSERAHRRLLHLVLSLPEAQLG